MSGGRGIESRSRPELGHDSQLLDDGSATINRAAPLATAGQIPLTVDKPGPLTRSGDPK